MSDTAVPPAVTCRSQASCGVRVHVAGSVAHVKCLQSALRARRSETSIARLRTHRERNFGHDATKVRSDNALAKLVLIEIFDARCVICGGFLGASRDTSESSIEQLIKSASATSIPIGTINLDHMRPASADGPDHILNYAPAHESCNKGRGNCPPTAEHEGRFRDAWLGYESNGHAQVLSRMIVAARDIEPNPARHVYMSGDTEQDRSAVAAELADDQIALRFEVRPCTRGHNFHVYPNDPDFCIKRGPEHECQMGTCRIFSRADHCWLEGGMKRGSTYPFTVFVDGFGRGHSLELARFLEAFVAIDDET